jgi:hypothetical protein
MHLISLFGWVVFQTSVRDYQPQWLVKHPFDMNYIYATYFLEQAEKQGVLVVNKAQSRPFLINELL